MNEKFLLYINIIGYFRITGRTGSGTEIPPESEADWKMLKMVSIAANFSFQLVVVFR